MVLEDVLRKNMDVVFCGTAVGSLSAKRGCYYANPSNKFWKTIYKVGLTSRLLKPEEYLMLTDFNIGLSDIVKSSSGVDSQIQIENNDVEVFKTKMLQYSPKIIAFNGKKAAQEVLQRFGKELGYGMQSEKIGNSILFVLPSTSGSASRWWQESYWQELARIID